jgi:hypothetical protein
MFAESEMNTKKFKTPSIVSEMKHVGRLKKGNDLLIMYSLYAPHTNKAQ